MKAHRAKKRSASPAGEADLLKRLKRAERRLRQVEERYEIAMGAFNEGVYDWDIAKDRIFYSESVQRALGLPPEILRTREGWWSLIHPEDQPRCRAAFVAHFKGATERFECDYRYRALDGTWRWARQHGIALRDASGRAVRMIGSTGDITELKHAEDSLRESEERYALATSAAVEGIYEWDVETGTLFLTEHAKDFFSFPAEEATPAAWNARVHPEDYPGYRAALVEHFKGLTPQIEHEYRIADGQGGYKWILDRGIGMRDASGRVTKLVGALSDITQRKRAEIELRRARDQAEEALEQQTATAEILRVISSSPTDVQPVFEAIVQSGIRLFEGAGVTVTRQENGQVRLMAIAERDPERARKWKERFPFPLTREYMHGAAILDCRMVDMPDVEQMDERFAAGKRNFAASGYRAMTVVPMIKDGVAIGTIAVVRDAAGPLSDKQIALLKTFADQAVIAIENVRLFNETKEALEQQTATAEVLGVISSSIADTSPVFDKILDSSQRLFEGHLVGLTLVEDNGMLGLRAYKGPHKDEMARIYPMPVDRDAGTGCAILDRKVVHFVDVDQTPSAPAQVRKGGQIIGFKSIIFAPLLFEGRGIGAIWVGRKFAGPFSEKQVALLKTFADQAVIAIQNERLFREIHDKSWQLEVASRHKSEFLANMSHELRTPLNAIIGFTRIVMRRSQEKLEPQQYENLEKILTSGQHLLALINSILDLAKVEAGRVEVNPGDIGLSPVLESCARTVEPLVKADAVTLVKEFDGALPQMYVDEEKLRQIVINLLSNAAKFTSRGSIRLQAHVSDGTVAIAVADTGIGIAPDKLEVIFEEFEQADASSTRVYGGTGLGLAIARRLARLLGGEITAESVLGSGSKFTLTLPLRYASPGA